MRKILISVLAALCLVCLGLAVACNKEPVYYTLTYEVADGITIESNAPSGWQIKEGFNVSFTVTIGEDMIGEPVVKANDDVLTADENGNYSFKISEDTVVTVSGVYKIDTYAVTFDRGDDAWIWFFSDEYDTEQEIRVSANTMVSFTFKASVYYGEQTYSILANSTVLNPDDNGVYTFEVTEDTTVWVSGLDPTEPDTPFYLRENGGKGTDVDPYRIERPIDLYAMADLIGSSFFQATYYNKYYRLEADIDMQGEQLFIIGDGIYSYFAGNFDGNNHTISNYYIKDTLIDQSTYLEMFMPYIGLFGYAMATTTRTAEIYDLNLENFTIQVDASVWGEGFSVGAVVGMGIGVNVTNCSASGIITADADPEKYFGFIGGIIGQQCSYNGNGVIYYSSVRSCTTDVEIRGESGYVYAAGGISGVLSSYDQQTSAFILNCYTQGDISGAMNAGGIVGYVSPNSSIKNCYATGNIEADNYISLMDGAESFSYAYSGGIAGYLDYDSLIADSFFLGSTYVYSAATAAGFGSQYAQMGDIAGYVNKASDLYLETSDGLIENCYSKANASIDDNFIRQTLGWDEGDWVFKGNGLPVINSEAASKSFVVTVNLGNKYVSGSNTVKLNVTDMYIPMSYWYLIEDGLPQFIETDDGLRSFGYYFDAELTRKVPFSYVPTTDMTLYTGFANYNDVAGKYYLRTGVENSEVYIELGLDGTLTYRDGAVNYITYYIYDGTTVTLYVCPAFTVSAISYDDNNNVIYAAAYFSGRATLEGGVLTMINMIKADSTAIDTTVGNYTPESPLIAVKYDEGFTYGEYYAASGASYIFYKDGTGTYGGRTFTYTVSDSSVELTYTNGEKITGTVAGGVITKINGVALNSSDAYVGVWEKSAGSNKQYSFDGKGAWSYEYFGYDSEGKKVVIKSESGSYTVKADGSLALDNGVTAAFDGDGFITIGNETYYSADSYKGVWRYNGSSVQIELVLGGISTEGYGVATMDYGSFYGSYELTYEAVKDADGKTSLAFYYFDTLFGTLEYDAADKTLKGDVYSAAKDTISVSAIFCLYDDYKGEWKGGDFGSAVFNGFGNYNLGSTGSSMPVKGSVKIDGTTVTYTLENATLKGSFTYNGVEYTTEYDEENDVIIVTYEGGQFTLVRNVQALEAQTAE